MIETERLTLRPHRLEDFEAFHAMAVDPEVTEFIAAGIAATREESWTKLMRNGGHWSFFGYGLLAIVERASGRYVGQTGLADFHRGLGERFDPFPEAAWAVASPVHGRGYATEAPAAAHRWFDEAIGPTPTVCIIDTENASSLRVAEKLGYRPFGEVQYKGKRVMQFERTAAAARSGA